MNKFHLPLLLLISLSLSACVSKKKYDELAAAKKRSDMKLVESKKEKTELDKKLTSKTKEANKTANELSDLKAEFNAIKNEMLASNAQKSSLIEDLNGKLSMLSTDHKSAKDSLQQMIARLDKKDKKYNERHLALTKEMSNLDKIKAALNLQNQKLLDLEKFLNHNMDKNNISGVYTRIEGGFLLLSFDPDMFFATKDESPSSDGIRILKILAAAVKSQSDIRLSSAANWNEDISDEDAWKKTQVKSNKSFALLNEYESLASQSLSMSNEKMDEQKLGVSTHELAFILFPPLVDLSSLSAQ